MTDAKRALSAYDPLKFRVGEWTVVPIDPALGAPVHDVTLRVTGIDRESSTVTVEIAEVALQCFFREVTQRPVLDAYDCGTVMGGDRLFRGTLAARLLGHRSNTPGDSLWSPPAGMAAKASELF